MVRAVGHACETTRSAQPFLRAPQGAETASLIQVKLTFVNDLERAMRLTISGAHLEGGVRCALSRFECTPRTFSRDGRDARVARSLSVRAGQVRIRSGWRCR